MQNVDHRDEQVKGLDRYIPSKISKSLLVLLLSNLLLAIYAFINPKDQIIKSIFGKVSTDDPVKFLLFTLVIIAFGLIIELAIILNHSKQSRVTHYSLIHPAMSFKMLWANATTKHYLLLLGVFVAGLFLGAKYL